MRFVSIISLLTAAVLIVGCPSKPGKDEPKGAEQAQVDPFQVVQVSTGYYNSYALLAGGTVRSWGQGQHGQLGNGTGAGSGRFGDPKLNTTTPVQVEGLKDVIAIEAGHGSTGSAGSTVFAITKSGKVFFWGSDDLSPLGSKKDENKPVEAPALKGAKKISLGLGHACALMGDATVQCWGGGYSGEMGNGKKESNKIPQPVPGIKDVVDLACGSSHVCVALKDGKAKCWGRNWDKQVSLTAGSDQLSPVDIPGLSDVVAVGASGRYSCAVLKDASMKCWGNRAKATEVLGSDVAEVEGGDDHICMRKKDGTVHCWGDNDLGQLGQGQAKKPYNSGKPIQVKGIKDAVDISPGYEHTCAVTKANEVFCWGTNKYGELGDGSLIDRPAPVKAESVAKKELPAPNPGFNALPVDGDKQTWDKLPKGCAHATLDMKHKALLRPKFDIQSAYFEKDSRGTITVVFSNFPMLKDKRRRYPRGDQLTATLYFLKVKDPKADKEERLPADVGVYGISTETERHTGAMSSVSNTHTSFELRSGVSKESNIELTYVADDYVCGTLNVTNKYGHMKGTFAAPARK